jgi:hypothetical protein
MRYCTNCRAVIPAANDVCPACGVYAGDVFDGRLPKASGERRTARRLWLPVLVAIVAAGAGAWWWWTRVGQFPKADTGPIRVVGDRPGGVRRPAGAGMSEAEAILTLRHFFAARPDAIKSECLAVMSRGYSNDYYSFDTVDSCARTRLGRWRVNAKTRAVSR